MWASGGFGGRPTMSHFYFDLNVSNCDTFRFILAL